MKITRRRRCLDKDCPQHKIVTMSERKHFVYHVLKKSTLKIIDILESYGLIKYPEQLQRYTLVNLLVDFSTEPVASEIIENKNAKWELKNAAET